MFWFQIADINLDVTRSGSIKWKRKLKMYEILGTCILALEDF